MASPEVAYCATPEARFTVPSGFVPSMNTTEPIGATPPVPEIATVAVKVTGLPTVDGLPLEVNRVVVPSCTAWVYEGELLERCDGSFRLL